MLTDSDFEEIRQLFARYSHTLDFGDAEGFAACFTEDGALDTSSPEDGVLGVHSGHVALRKFVGTTAEYSGGNVRQSALNVLIEGDETKARANSFVFISRAYDDLTNAYGRPSEATRASLETTGMFFDELVKVDGRWRFSLRQFRNDGLPDVLDRVLKPVTLGPLR